MARLAFVYSILRNSHKKQLKQRRNERRIMRYTDKAFSMNEDEFRANYRVSKSLFEEIFENIKPFLSTPKRRSDISPKYKVLVALSFYATGSYQKLVGGTYGTLMSQQSVSRCIRDETAAFNHPVVLSKWIKFPQTRQERDIIKRRFYEKFHIPSVIGCIDGTHVAIIRPTENEERFFNRKHFHSRNVLIICDADLRILSVDASFGGASHDSFVWNQHPIKQHLIDLNNNGENVFLLAAVVTGVVTAVRDHGRCKVAETSGLIKVLRDKIRPICGGQCCGRGREAHLRNYVRKSAEDRVGAASRPVAELLLATKRTLQEHLTALSHQSQNKTAVLFTHIYKNHAIRAHAPLSSLYDDIRILLRSTGEDHELGSPPPKDMAISAKKFFKEIFPVAYQNILKLESKQFTQEYEACLKDAYNGVQPFGDVPEQLGSSLSRSLESARALLQVLAVGAGALLDSQQILSSMSSECASRLLRVGGCARCRNHQASPCRNYCLNVARGCIGSLLSELDAPWAGYVEGVERVARADADAALRTLDSRVSEAIMHALENHVILEKKVRQECGPPTTVEVAMLTTPRPTGPRRDPLRAPPPDAELLQFTATLASSRSLFADIADTVCDDPELVYDGNDRCWNGEAVGEYTKALVASASVSDQKYNPEVPAAAAQDARVAALGDKLRQARQLLVSHSYKSSADSFMLGDEAGDEGSGSGRSYTDDDAAYDVEGSGEEGSGAVDIGTRTMIGEDTTYSAPPVAGSAANFRPLQFIFGITIVIWLT